MDAFGIVWVCHKTKCKTGQTSAKVRATKSRRNFSQECTRSTPLDSKLIFWCVLTIWMHLGSFGCLTKLSAKWAERVQKFVPRSRVIIFRNEHTRLTPLRTKLMFWCVSYYLGAFGAVWLPYKTRCKTNQNGAKVRAMKSGRNFSQQTTRYTL